MRSHHLPIAFLLVLLSAFTLSSQLACRKRGKDCCGVSIQPGLTGNWLLKSIEGGFQGRRDVPADSPVVLTLNTDSTYHLQIRSQVVESGSFHIADTSVYGFPEPSLVFSVMGAVPYRTSKDTLFLGDDASDGLLRTYLKIN
jgi:hypothetical protein